MDTDKYSAEVQDGWKNGTFDDRAVRDSHIIRHQKCGCSQNWRHNLTAGRSGCLCRGGKLRRIPGFLHQRDGYRAGANGIRDGGTGYHALKGAANHRGFCGTAGESAHQRIGNIHEQIGDACTLQKRAEYNKDDNELGTDVNGCGQDALLTVEQVTHCIVHSAGKRGIAQTPDQRIDEKASGNHQNRQTNAAPAYLSQARNANNANQNLIPCKPAALLNNIHCVESEVKKGASTGNHHHDIVPRDVVDTLNAFPCRVYQKTQ